jgi:flagellin-like hook-associated protein FlgL
LDLETRAKFDIDRGGNQIRNADMASESAETARQQAKSQASQAIMAQSVRIQRQAIDSLLNG